MPRDTPDDIALVVAGREFTGWEEIELATSLEAIAGTFTLKVTDRNGGVLGSTASPWPIPPDSPCELHMGRDVLLTGFVDSIQVSFAPRQHTVEVAGRDRTCDLVDCSALNEPGEWNGVGLLQLVEDLARPYGIAVVAGLSDFGDPFYRFAIQPGETAFESIERACRLRAVLPTGDERGRVVLTRAKQTGASVRLVEGENLLAGSLSLDSTGRYAEYIVRGQQQGSDTNEPNVAAGPEGRFADPRVRAGRRLLIVAEGMVDDARARLRATWESQVRAARAQPVTVVVQGWRQYAGGPPWKKNELVRTISPTLRLGAPELLVVAVRMRRSVSAGTTTELALARPGAYLPERIPTAEDDLAAGMAPDVDGGGEAEGD